MTCRFPKSARLLRRPEFQRTLDKGQRAAASEIVVAAHPTASEGGARLGLVVSRKVGNSVTRNRVKRRLREWFRQKRSALPGLDLVVIARSESASASYDALAQSFGSCVRRVEKRLQAQARAIVP